MAAPVPRAHDVLVTRELLDPNRPAGVKTVWDADLPAHAELAAVRELWTRYAARSPVDALQKRSAVRCFRHDRFVVRSRSADVPMAASTPRHARAMIASSTRCTSRPRSPGARAGPLEHHGIAAHLAAGVEQSRTIGPSACCQRVDQQRSRAQCPCAASCVSAMVAPCGTSASRSITRGSASRCPITARALPSAPFHQGLAPGAL